MHQRNSQKTGGHAQSVAAALKAAGADKVSILAIARWLDMNDSRTRANREGGTSAYSQKCGVLGILNLSLPLFYRFESVPVTAAQKADRYNPAIKVRADWTGLSTSSQVVTHGEVET